MSRLRSLFVPWLALGMLGVSACEPGVLGEDDDPGAESPERTAQGARPPSLTRVDPVAFIAGTEGELTITGKGFIPGLSVSVGGLAAPPPRTVSATKIQVAIPAGVGPGAAVAVKVTLPDGRSGERADLLAVLADPMAFAAAQPVRKVAVAGPRSPVVADFNLDGRPDVALISQTSSSIVVQLGSATGSSVTVSGPVIASAFDLFTGDLNLDGKPDLVVTTTGSPSVGVMLGSGDGTFQPVAWLTVGGFAFSTYQHNQVDIGDLNADGKPDLVIGDVSGNVQLVPGNGDGTFAATVNLASLSQPVRAVRLADIDGVAGLDVVAVGGLVAATPGDGTLAAIARQMDGTFKVVTNSKFAESLFALAVVDYDGDGKKDAVTLSGSGKLQFYRGAGDATFGAPVSNAVSAGGSFLLAGDMNSDGKLDFITGGRTYDGDPYAVTTLNLSNGDGTVRSTVLDAAAQHTGGALADMNKDGKLDLVLASALLGELQITAGRGDGSFVSPWPLEQATATAFGDFNADGKLDLAYVGSTQNKLSLALGGGDGTFAPPRTFAIDRGPSALTTGDFNTDGKLDVMVSCYDTGVVSLLLGNGDGTFAAQRTFSVGKGPNAVAAADLDGDGKLDVVTANTDSDNVSVLLGNGTGNFATSREYAAGKAPSGIALGDLNADGKLDVVTSNADSGNVAYLQGGTLSPGTLLAAKLFTSGTTPSAVAVSDVNADGKLDIVTVNSDTNNLAVHAGRGDGTFATARFSATCEFPISLALAELTGDGKVDAVVQCAAGKRSQALMGSGDGGFVPSPRVLALGSALAVADVNADLKPDLLIADTGAPLQVLLNTRK